MTSCTHSRAPPTCGCTRHPQCKPVSTLRFELCQPMTAALLVDKRSLRQVAVLWAARASHRLLTLVVVVLRPKAQGCVNYLVSGQWGLVSLWLGSGSFQLDRLQNMRPSILQIRAPSVILRRLIVRCVLYTVTPGRPRPSTSGDSSFFDRRHPREHGRIDAPNSCVRSLYNGRLSCDYLRAGNDITSRADMPREPR
jgi:hypothetical protein